MFMKNPGQTSYLKKKLHFDILGSTCNTKYYDLQELASNVKKEKAILPTAISHADVMNKANTRNHHLVNKSVKGKQN